MKRSTRSAVVGFSVAAALGATIATVAAEEIRVASSLLTISQSVEVPAPAAGVLQALQVREGQVLTAGDPVAQIDPREQNYQAEVKREELAVARRESESDVRVRLARKEHAVARAELARAASVNADLPNTISAKEIDRLRLAVERTELEIEHAEFERELLVTRLGRLEADLRLGEHRVERLRIETPIVGVVAELRRRAGEWVDAGQTIARVVRVDRLRVEGYVEIQQATLGLVGRPVTVTTRDLPGGAIQAPGRVTFVSPEAEPVDSKVRFWAEVENDSLRLRPGLRASVVIHDAPVAGAVAATREP